MAVEQPRIYTHMHFRGWVDPKEGKNFSATDREGFLDIRKEPPYVQLVKPHDYPRWEVVPNLDERGCCCCCGCLCNCTIEILEEVIPLTDPSCEQIQEFAFVKHQQVGGVIEATQTETYTAPIPCGDDPEIGGIFRTITKESWQESHIMSTITADVGKPLPSEYNINIEQIDKLITFYYRRITIELDQICTIPDAAWRLNPTTSDPEIIDPNYRLSCDKCNPGTLNPLAGAGIKQCCTDEDSEITCVFSVVDGKGQIAITGTVVGLWQYDDSKELKPASLGPTLVCRETTTGERFYERDSHTWDDARHGRVGSLAPVMLATEGFEVLRIRRKAYRFLTTPPEEDDNDIPDTICEAYEKGNVTIELLDEYDSRAPGDDGSFDLEYEIDSTRSFNPNEEESEILGSPVQMSGATETYEHINNAPFYYEPHPPKCKQCALSIEVGVDTVEIMEPGCFPSGAFCYYNAQLVSTHISTHRRITDPLRECFQSPIDSEGCDAEDPGDGIYEEWKTEHQERYYWNSTTQVEIFATVSPDGFVTNWYADISQDDHLSHIFYIQETYITNFGDGCFFNNCGDNSGVEENDCGAIIPDLFNGFTNPLVVGGEEFPCFWESDTLTTSCVDGVITLSRESVTNWSWHTVNAARNGTIFGSPCVGPLFVAPPDTDQDLYPGCTQLAAPFSEYLLPSSILPCDAPKGIGGTVRPDCNETGFSFRKHRYILRRKSSRQFHDLRCAELRPGSYRVELQYADETEEWTIIIDELVETFDEFWQIIFDVIMDAEDGLSVPEGLLVELVKDEDDKNIGIRITEPTVCEQGAVVFGGPSGSGARAVTRQFNSTPLINFCKDAKAGDVEWCFLEVLEDRWTPPTKYFELDGEIRYDPNLPDASGFYPVTSVSGSGSFDYDTSSRERAGSFILGQELLTVRPEFYMMLGATSVVCPEPDEE